MKDPNEQNELIKNTCCSFRHVCINLRLTNLTISKIRIKGGENTIFMANFAYEKTKAQTLNSGYIQPML